MNKAIFDIDELDLNEFEQAGLARDGKILVEPDDLEALLSGRRTSMNALKDLYFDGFHIAALNAKLSLKAGGNGKPELLLHPLYKEKRAPDYLSDSEQEALERGELANVVKRVPDGEGDPREVLVEFDKETNEYVVTDIARIIAPDFVNGEPLSLDKKERYRKGKEVQLDEGTKFQYAATERQGLRANKVALVAAILFDGGLSFLLYKGLTALFGQKDVAKFEELSAGYHQAVDDMKRAEGDPEQWLSRQSGLYARSYSR